MSVNKPLDPLHKGRTQTAHGTRHSFTSPTTLRIEVLLFSSQ